ncbi:MAG TPA: hypothetical protein VHW05_10560 [Phenylobacterium sp.]|nr:hypothetical protein [Phenylobacterium sp.]
MSDNIVSLPGEVEVARALRALARDPAARARATQILRDELRIATRAERARLIEAITQLDRIGRGSS